MNLPVSWAEITISQYHKLITIFNLFKEDAVERQIHLLALFTGQSVKEIEKLKVTDLAFNTMKLSFMNELPDGKVTTHFDLKGKKYKACILTSDMQAGQFVDFSHAGKGCSPEELPYHMHELIACMCLTKKEGKWQYEGYTETADDFLDMPMLQAYPYYVFFCNVLINLQKPILESSLKQLKKLVNKDKEAMEKIKKIEEKLELI